jgi:hypothetical protein
MGGEHLESCRKVRDDDVGNLDGLVLDQWEVGFVLKHWFRVQYNVNYVILEVNVRSQCMCHLQFVHRALIPKMQRRQPQ